MATTAEEANVEAEPADLPAAEPAESETHGLMSAALEATLVVDAVLAAGVAFLDLGYGQGATHIIGVGL